MACTLLTILVFVTLHRTEDYHSKVAKFFYEVAPAARKELKDKDVRMLSLDDGIVAYALGATHHVGYRALW
ncbi:MAG: hypothetical protein GY811_27165 [Myxococcales bacterium]|nr:hypothetical protein [Myxococcales bacterium]